VPLHVGKEDLERLVATFGIVQKCELVSSNMNSSVMVTYDTPEQAVQAVEQLNDYDYQGSVLKVDYAENGSRPRPLHPRNAGGSSSGNGRGTGYPLRIFVPSELVGAIIGRKGQTIRNITTQSRARVDVHRAESSGMLEQVICIYGQPDNCTNACKEIMKVMQQELSATNRGDVVLKMLTDDRHCGRIIGKEGKVIKKIREDSETKIIVSNVQEMSAIYPDRVIAIRGSIDGMSAAEFTISNILRECFERELQMSISPPMDPLQQSCMSMMAGAPYGMRSPYNGHNTGGPSYYPSQQQGMYGNPMQQAPPPPSMLQVPSVCQIKVPNSAVGAIIGAGGSNIKQIIQDSSAFIKIEPKKDDDPNPAVERLVTIKGSQEAQWRACYFIFEKLRQEGFSGNDDVRLCTVIFVTRSVVGRVIGKGGKNVRDIQRMTGAMVKLPEDHEAQSDEMPVEIFGNFPATQNTMSRIRALINQGQVKMHQRQQQSVPLYGGHQMGGQMGPPPPPRRGPSPRDQN